MHRKREIDEYDGVGESQAALDDVVTAEPVDNPAFTRGNLIEHRVTLLPGGVLPARLKLNTVDMDQREVERPRNTTRQGCLPTAAITDERYPLHRLISLPRQGSS